MREKIKITKKNTTEILERKLADERQTCRPLSLASRDCSTTCENKCQDRPSPTRVDNLWDRAKESWLWCTWIVWRRTVTHSALWEVLCRSARKWYFFSASTCLVRRLLICCCFFIISWIKYLYVHDGANIYDEFFFFLLSKASTSKLKSSSSVQLELDTINAGLDLL